MTRAEIQAFNNFMYALRAKNLDQFIIIPSKGMCTKVDRVTFVCKPEVEDFLNTSPGFTKDPLILKKAHPTAYASWRENCSTFSLQVCLGYDGMHKIEVDCDYGRPFYDVVGWVMHGFEVCYNKVTGRVTNPFKVRDVWNKRGYGIPLASEA